MVIIMIKNFINTYKSLDSKTLKILRNGLKFSFIICLLSIFILLTYIFFFTFPTLYYIGLLMFQLSLSFAIEFIICAIVVDSIKKNII